MQGKRVVITGPTSGVGKQIAIELAALGAEIILGCRDLPRGRQAAAEITRRSSSAKLVAMRIDTSSQASIRLFARDFRTRYRRLHVLINNASMNRGTLPKVNSADGIELTFATNVLGYFLLTQELLPVLQASAPSRIINVASQYAGDLDLADLQFSRRPFESIKAYAQSKACDRLLTWAFARRLKGTGVTVNAMTPGLIMTGLYRDAPTELVERLRGYSGGRTVQEGADTAVWLASDPKLEKVTNKFFVEDREQADCEFRDKADEEKLWKICEQLTSPARVAKKQSLGDSR